MVVSGFVYEKLLGDKIKGVPKVAVSNGQDVVLTNEEGAYTLPLREENTIIFVTKPTGYNLLVDQYNQAKYYYRHFPEGTNAEIKLQYPGIGPTGELPSKVNFYLTKSEKDENDFSIIMMGDIQPKSVEDVSHFRNLFISEMARQEVEFIMLLGDIAWDDLSLYPLIKETLTTMNQMYFPVCGNHDINLRAPDKKYATETFKKYFGPTYYSFNYGKVHFVVLEDIGYSGWNEEEEIKGNTYGWMDEVQLEWLENDLAFVPEDHFIFIASHIPIYTATAAENPYRNIQNRPSLFKVLETRKHLFAISAHTHCIEHVDLKEADWQGETSFQALIAGAACGAWWKGPLDFDGIPVRMALDGAPNGYFKFEFKGIDFDFEFIPAGQSRDKQMAIRYPSGDISQDNLPDEILVNIFAISSKSKVHYRINNEFESDMQVQTGFDPYVNTFIEKHPQGYPEWMRARVTNHIWTAPWPTLSKPGIHTIEITATTPDGKYLKHREAFRILPPDNASETHNIIALERMIKALSD